MKKMIQAAFFVALGLILPFLTGQIPEVGSALLPMHLPILICGYICGWKYGLIAGFITPLLRSLLFSMPPLPTAICMAFELAAYGAVIGILYQRLKNSKFRIYLSLLAAMIIGRLVWGAASIVVYGLSSTAFTWQMFLTGALLSAIPGIILQVVLIPILVMALEKSGVIENYA
ncbi:MAG: ECF transporter S component [Eubacterium sp.]|nr:ECF transporter S component [Eubacterium sp.]